MRETGELLHFAAAEGDERNDELWRIIGGRGDVWDSPSLFLLLFVVF